MSVSVDQADSLTDLLSELQSRDVRLRAYGDRLQCDAPAGVLSPELRARLAQKKNQILEYLRRAEAVWRKQSAIVPLQPRGSRLPVFGVPGHNGDVFCYKTLSNVLGSDQPFFGLQPQGLDGKTKPMTRIENTAQYFADQIRSSHSTGPYIIVGYCAGGSTAFELARQLQRQGGKVELLALFGCPYPTFYNFLIPRLWVKRMIMHGYRVLDLASRNGPDETPDSVIEMRAALERAALSAARRYRPGHFRGRMSLILPNRQWLNSKCAPHRWRTHCDDVEEFFGPDDCDHNEMLRGLYAPITAELFRRRLPE
jgi:thioesterase domain-containing protein